MEVIVYTKNNCMQCNMTKNVLNGEGIEFKAINVDELDEAKKEETVNYIKEELGFTSMPVIVAEGHEAFAGFQPDKLKTLK